MFYKKTVLLFAGLILAVILAAACGGKKYPWGDPASGLILQYRMPENEKLKYQSSSDFTMNLDIMGQPMEIKVNDASEFSFESKGPQDNNLQLGVTIDSWSISVTTPQGNLNPDMSSIIGKTFNMTLSFRGKELDVSGADALEFEARPGEKHNVASTFQALFPDLPQEPVKIGDIWASTDAITEKSSNDELHILTDSKNKLDGFEIVDGMECARITAVFSGTMNGKGKQGGMDMVTTGDMEGAYTWYFAYKEGIFVKSTLTGNAKGTITGSGPQTITIPMTREFTIETRLVQ